MTTETPQEIANERAEVMMHFANGGAVEFVEIGYTNWGLSTGPTWNWTKYDYRKSAQPKKKVTLYYWLVSKEDDVFFVTCATEAFVEMGIIERSRKLTAADDPRFAPVEIEVDE